MAACRMRGEISAAGRLLLFWGEFGMVRMMFRMV